MDPPAYKYITVLCFGYATFQASLSPAAAHYATVAEDYGFSSSEIGIIQSLFSFANLFASPFVPAVISRLGRKFALWLSLLLISISVIAQGIATVSDNNKDLFLFMSIIFKILNGAAAALFIPASFTLVSYFYRENLDRMIAIFKMQVGIGVASGLVF